MSATLHALLDCDEPTMLKNIERALDRHDELTPDQEAALSALVWSRCVFDRGGMLETVLNHACAKRIDVLPDHLETVGAKEAALAVRKLRKHIPLKTSEVQAGLVDWIETEKHVQNIAGELDEELEDIRPLIWEFMRDPARELPDIQVPASGLGRIAFFYQQLIGREAKSRT